MRHDGLEVVGSDKQRDDDCNLQKFRIKKKLKFKINFKISRTSVFGERVDTGLPALAGGIWREASLVSGPKNVFKNKF